MIPAATPLHRHTALTAILVTARAIVSDPARWCPWPDALDAGGERCDGREHRAVRWGAYGALDRASADAGVSSFRFEEARQCLSHAALRIGHGWNGTPWMLNQNAARRMTIASFDAAIKALAEHPSPAIVDALAVARILIASPDRWARGAIALDHRDRALTTYEGACSFCASGALGLATGVLYGDHPDGTLANCHFEVAERRLDCAASQLGDYQSYITLNERDDHAQVLAMFDRALLAASSAPAPHHKAS